MNGTSLAPQPIKPAAAEEEEEDEEEESDDEYDDDDDDEADQESSISAKGWLWGSLAIGAVAVSVAALVAVARRR